MNESQTPLLDLLRGTPRNGHTVHEESPTSHHFIPYGRLCHDAADLIEQQAAWIKDLEAEGAKQIDLLHQREDRLQAQIKELEEALDEANCPRMYVKQGGTTRCIYGTSSIVAFKELEEALRHKTADAETWERTAEKYLADRTAIDTRLAALRSKIENAEVVAWQVHGGEIWNTPVSPYKDDRGTPLIRKEDLLK